MRFFLFLLLALPCAAAVDTPAMLHAIAQVETGGRNVRGRAGEHSPYQLTPAVWHRYRGTAKQRAAAHLHYLASKLPNPTTQRLALAWNGGLGSVDRPSAAQRDYANRVTNLYYDALQD